MSLAALLAFAQSNGTTLLGLWVLFEQYLAANKKIKANSTAQLVIGVADTLIKKAVKK